MENHGFSLSNHKEKIFDLIKKNINQCIYLADMFSREDVEKINMDSLEIENVDYKNIENKFIMSKIANHIKKELDKCIKLIKENKNNKETIKEQVDKFLMYANKLYCEMQYSDRTLWTKLKEIDAYISLNELRDSYYVQKLKEYPEIIKLFFNGKYKDNYLKNNIYADKIIEGIK